MKLRYYIFILLTIVTIDAPIWGQRYAQNRPNIDNKRWNFGFSVGLHLQDATLVNSGVVGADGAIWFGQIPTYVPGFTVGIFGEVRLHQYLSLRLHPAVHFGERQFEFWEQHTGQTERIALKSTQIELPLLFRVNSKRVSNYRFYLLAGASANWDVGKKTMETLLTKPFDAQIQIGVGCNIYLPYFTLSPEFKVCIGLLDQIERTRNELPIPGDIKYTNAISRLTSQLFILQFNFE